LKFLLDWELITQKLGELQISDKEAENIKKAIQHKEAEYSRIKSVIFNPRRQKMTIREFEPLAIIGKGAFGEVRICKHIQSSEIFAIKKMKKEEMHTKNQILHIRAERDVLSEAHNPWIVDLKYSFQV
jgi:serine/threonine kinase 38